MLVALILICEVAFWVFIAAGLAARYLLRRPRLGAVLLIAAPVVDLVLLTGTAVDLRGGGEATFAHGLAAIYLGTSVGFGHRMITWADVRFAHRYAGGPAPVPKPRCGAARATYEQRGWLQHLLAWAVGTGLLMLAVVVVGDSDRTTTLTQVARVWTVVLVIDAVVSFSYRLWPQHAPETGRGDPD